MINSHKVTKHACTSSWSPLAHSIHHTYHQVTVMNKQQKNKGYKQLIYIHISCKCDTNRAGHFTLDAHASRPVVWLTHWGRVTHIRVSKLSIIGSDNGLSPGRRQAIIWNNDGIWLIRTFGKNFSEIFSKIHTFSFKKIHLKKKTVWKRTAILSRPQWVNQTVTDVTKREPCASFWGYIVHVNGLLLCAMELMM